MSRLGSWFRGSAPKGSSNASPSDSQVDLLAQDCFNIEDAMAGAANIMNDDIDGAEEILKKLESPFHSLGLGVCQFMRSILGFEKEIMSEASKRLLDVESSAWAAMKKAQKAGNVNKDAIYPPGTHYALVHAEAQLMSAVIGVLHESLTDGVRGFYKLRKAFITLDGIMEAEAAFLKRKGHLINGDSEQKLPAPEKMPGAFDDSSPEDTDLEFVDAAESKPDEDVVQTYEGHLAEENEAEKKLAELSLKTDGDFQEKDEPKLLPERQQVDHGPESELFNNTIDVFIHSGTNMCFGILQLLISMVPPAFSRLLYIIGFKGDRERGIRMLWQSSRFPNINGTLASFVLLAYYNGLLAFADILPSDEEAENGAIVGYPRARCAALLKGMRQRYPDSKLWRLEEGRILANSKDLAGALKVLQDNGDSKMRQVTAINNFELCLDSMFVQHWTDMRDNFLRSIELNNWSHALYYYLAGAAETELYRDAYHAEVKDEAKIKEHKKKAEEYYRKAPTVAGKKRFMARPIPFELFVQRKLTKWEERSKELGIDLVDAVGVSPAEEVVYFWNGSKRMGEPELEKAVNILRWERLTASEEASARIKAEPDESANMDLLLSSMLRNQGKLAEAKAAVEPLLKMDKIKFQTANRDDFALPAAHYEMAVLAWVEVQKIREASAAMNGSASEADKKSQETRLRALVDECESWLDKVAKWDTFILDARIGMRVSTGRETLKWFRKQQGWTSA